jgi:uncharacterized membrane protein YccC
MAETTSPLIGLAQHPRAAESIRRAKAWGGLVGFLLVGVGSWLHGAMLFDAGVRALAGGLVGHFVAWAAAIAVWGRVLDAQAKVAVAAALEKHAREATRARAERPRKA